MKVLPEIKYILHALSSSYNIGKQNIDLGHRDLELRDCIGKVCLPIDSPSGLQCHPVQGKVNLSDKGGDPPYHCVSYI